MDCEGLARADSRGGGSRRAAARGFTRGFTLIEILMALMVLTVGLASVLSVFVHGVRSSRRSVDESAASLTARTVLARILSEDDPPDGERDFLAVIERCRSEGAADWVWVHDKTKPLWGTAGVNPKPESVPAPVPVAQGSIYSWRCRASRCRKDPKDKDKDGVKDLMLARTGYVRMVTGRVSRTQEANPDSDDLWRLSILVYRKYELNPNPVASFQTFVCTAHR